MRMMHARCDRRRFVTTGFGGLIWAAVPGALQLTAGRTWAADVLLKGDGFCAWDYHLDAPLPRAREGKAPTGA